ncbi:MAG TPA: hypothetical protein VF200_05900 [Woeseiaceae bacterium]
MKKSSLFSACAASLLLTSVALACDYPKSPDVPNGSTASKDEMVDGQKAVKAYIKQLEDYQQCLVDEEENARAGMDLEPDQIKQREEMLTKKYNAAHEDMVKVAAAFNEELKEWQSRDAE